MFCSSTSYEESRQPLALPPEQVSADAGINHVLSRSTLRGSHRRRPQACRLFLTGGRSLVVSQWPVDDRATSLLMVRFYQNLLGRRERLEQPLSKAAALAEAKRWLCSLRVEDVEAGGAGERDAWRDRATHGGLALRPALCASPLLASFILIGDPGDTSQAVPVLAPAAAPVEQAGSSFPYAIAVAVGGMPKRVGVFSWQLESPPSFQSR